MHKKTLKGVSMKAKAVSRSMRTLVCISQALTGDSIIRSSMYTQKPAYRFGSWKVPKEYENTEIKLKNSRGYLLCRKDSSHQKIVYQIHGGGFVATFSNLYNKTALHFSKICNADVFSIDYRTAPDHVFPCALEDAMDGYAWILNQGYSPENIILCGESAGGGLVLSLTMKLRDENMPLPRALILSSPWTDQAAEGKSYSTKKTEDYFFGHPDAAKVPKYPVPTVYAADHDKYDPYLSPAYGSFQGFPPMLIQTGEAELLLSDSDTIVQSARKAGVDVTYYTYPGMYHTFYITQPDTREGKTAWRRIEKYVRKNRI